MKARRCQVPPSSVAKMYTAPAASDPKFIVVPLSLASPGSPPAPTASVWPSLLNDSAWPKPYSSASNDGLAERNSATSCHPSAQEQALYT